MSSLIQQSAKLWIITEMEAIRLRCHAIREVSRGPRKQIARPRIARSVPKVEAATPNGVGAA